MQELPQVCKATGISQDYINEYNRSLPVRRKGIEAMLQSLRKWPMQHYEQRFDPSVYDYDTSNPRIPIINQITDYVNSKARDGTLDLERFLAMENEVFALIHGFSLRR